MGSKTILVAEAEQYILDLLDFNLKQTGFDVVIAMNGAEAMAAVASHFPSLILLDRQLPVMDGDEVCRRIKEYKATTHIPVIMMSTRSEEDDIVSALENGADDYVAIPFSVAELIARTTSAALSFFAGSGSGTLISEPWRSLNWDWRNCLASGKLFA